MTPTEDFNFGLSDVCGRDIRNYSFVKHSILPYQYSETFFAPEQREACRTCFNLDGTYIFDLDAEDYRCGFTRTYEWGRIPPDRCSFNYNDGFAHPPWFTTLNISLTAKVSLVASITYTTPYYDPPNRFLGNGGATRVFAISRLPYNTNHGRLVSDLPLERIGGVAPPVTHFITQTFNEPDDSACESDISKWTNRAEYWVLSNNETFYAGFLQQQRSTTRMCPDAFGEVYECFAFGDARRVAAPSEGCASECDVINTQLTIELS